MNKRRHMGRILMGVLGLQAASALSGQGGNIQVTISTVTNVYEAVTPIELRIEATSSGANVTKVRDLDVFSKTVSIEVLRDGKEVSQIHWDGPRIRNLVDLSQKNPLRLVFEITRLYYPMVLQDGEYEVVVRYWATNDKDSVLSNKLRLTIKALSDDEKKAFEAYQKVFHAGEHASVVKFGTNFLARYPASILANRVRMETAQSQKGIGASEESVKLYRQVIETEKAPWLREQAREQLAHTLFKMGDLEGAIREMESVEIEALRGWWDFQPRRKAELWRQMLKQQKKQDASTPVNPGK